MFYCHYCGRLVLGLTCAHCGATYLLQVVSGPTKEFQPLPAEPAETYDKQGNRIKRS